MKEGPEALVGGPLLSLSVGPALSAFRLRLPGRDTTPDPLEDMLFSHFVHWHLPHPHLPSKGLSAAALPTWYFFSGGFLAWEVGLGMDTERVEGGGRETRYTGCALGPVIWLLFRSILQLLLSHWSL